MAKIRHIAIFAEDPKTLADFYVRIYGMKITGESQGDVWVTDGYMDVALIRRKREGAPKGIHHFGFTLEPEEKPFVYAEMKKMFGPKKDGDKPADEDKGMNKDDDK